mgnify:CR=1 FL=1
MSKDKFKSFQIIIPVICHKCRATELIDRTDPASGWTHSANGKLWFCPKCSR